MLLVNKNEPWHKRILDPGSDIVLQWNRVFIFACLVALFVDPLYFYLPSVGGNANTSCVKTDTELRIVVTLFRTVADLFYLLHMVIKFRTAYIAPSTRVFGRGELVMDPKKIAQRYLRSDFFIDLIATLPLPQVFYFDISIFNFLVLYNAMILQCPIQISKQNKTNGACIGRLTYSIHSMLTWLLILLLVSLIRRVYYLCLCLADFMV